MMLRRILFFILALSNVNLNGQGPIFQLAPLSDQHANVIASAPAPDCSDGEVHDDGTFEVVFYGPLTEAIFVELFTPPAYPYECLQFCIGLSASGSNPDFNLDLVVYDDDGVAGAPGTLLASIPVTALDVPLLPGGGFQFYSFDVSGQIPVVNNGSVYIGFHNVNTVGKQLYIRADETGDPSTPLTAFYSDDPVINPNFVLITNAPNLEALALRASGQLHSSGAASVPTLSQWSVLILSLVLGIVGVVRLRQRNVVNPR